MRIRVLPIVRIAAVLCLGAALSACVSGVRSSGARAGAMTPALSPGAVITETSPLHDAVQIGRVTGGSTTNAMGKSQVSNETFRTALEQALVLHTMAADDRPRFILSAELISLAQPSVGVNATVTASVHYRLQAVGSERVVMDDVIATPYTATIGDAIIGVERLRLANEGAMRENISTVMQKLVSISGTLPTS